MKQKWKSFLIDVAKYVITAFLAVISGNALAAAL